MSNLQPVKRLNKNGVLVTKHVRVDKTVSKTAGIPPVMVAPKTVQPKAQKNLMKKREEWLKKFSRPSVIKVSQMTDTLSLSPRLYSLVKPSYDLKCSSDNFYKVLEHFSVTDTVALLSAGLPPEQTESFIKRERLEDTVVDNSELVKELKRRAIPANIYTLVAVRDEYQHCSDDVKLDVAEALMYFKPKKDTHIDFAQMVSYGQIDFNDIKEIGLNRCGAYKADFQQALTYMKNGNSACSSTELGLLIDECEDNFSPKASDYERRLETAVTTRLAYKYGVDAARDFSNLYVYYYCEEDVDELSAPEDAAYLKYISQIDLGETSSLNEVVSTYATEMAAHRLELWKADIPAEVAENGLKSGLNPQQIIAVHQEGIASSVSQGWL